MAQFAAGGKPTGKKDLAQIAMTNGHVYVAQVAMGANPAQTLRALKEAESYDGPSLIIAYAPADNAGLKAGMNWPTGDEESCLEAGYWESAAPDPSSGVEEARTSDRQRKPNEDYLVNRALLGGRGPLAPPVQGRT